MPNVWRHGPKRRFLTCPKKSIGLSLCPAAQCSVSDVLLNPRLLLQGLPLDKLEALHYDNNSLTLYLNGSTINLPNVSQDHAMALAWSWDCYLYAKCSTV
jgi:hypothetical protein